MTQPIPLTLHRWGLLISNKDPEFELVFYGMANGSSVVRKAVARRKADGAMFVAQTAAQFGSETDWEYDQGCLTTLHPARERVVYDLP